MNVRSAWLAFALLACNVGAVAQAPAVDVDWRYVVQPGDTLVTLASAWLAAPKGWRDLQRLNRLPDPLQLRPGTTLRMPIAWLRREAGVAEALFVKGEVSLERGSARAALAAGTSLQSGDRVRTGVQSSASLRFADGSRLLIPPESEVALEQLLTLGRNAISSVRLGLARGGADSRVAPNAQRVPMYEVRTPHVNLGVRGTEFRVQMTDGQSRIQVLSGAVRAAGVDVAAGHGLVAEGAAHSVAALLPAPDLSTLPRTAERLPLQMRWAVSPAGAVAWRAQLFAKADADRLLLDARSDEPVATWDLARELPDGDYTLRVRGIDVRGLEGAAAEADVQLQARPEPPFIRLPAPGADSYTGAIALAWARNIAAPDVRLQIARDAAFQDLALQPPPLDAAGFEARAAELGGYGTYHWRIASVEPGGRAGPFGDPQTFTLKRPPQAPPPAEPQVVGEQLRLRWQSDPEISHYELDWSRTEAFDGADLQRVATDKAEVSLPRPPPGKYFLRARGFNAAGVVSPWGQTQTIEQPYPRWLWLLPLLLIPLL